MCRLSVVCAEEKKTSPVCSAMTRQVLPATLQIHKSTHKHTQAHTLLQASPVCLWLAHTCWPDQRARVGVQRPSMHVDSHDYKTHVRALAAFAGSLIGLIMIFFSHPVTLLILTRQCHLHDHRQTEFLIVSLHHNVQFTFFCHMKSGRKGNWCVAKESSVVSASSWITDRVGLRAVNCLAPSQSQTWLTLHGMNTATHPVSHSLSVCCSATASPSATPLFFSFFICKTAVFWNSFPIFRLPEECLI